MEFLKLQKRFSFKLDGVDCWTLPYQEKITRKGNELISTYIFENGLKVTNVAKKHEKHGAYEWVNHWENLSEQSTGTITELWDGDFFTPLPYEEPNQYPWAPALPDPKRVTKIYSPLGSSIGWQDFFADVDELLYNIPTYQLYAKGSPLSERVTMDFTNRGGRSSNGRAPFFNVHKEGKGVIVAVGWSGQWQARFERDDSHLFVKTKVQDTAFKMLPKEAFRTSSVVFLPYDGDVIEGQNQWRRLAREEFSAVGPEKRALYAPFSFGVWGGESSENVLKTIERLKEDEVRYEYLWMDAGWFGVHTRPTAGDHDNGEWAWHRQVGDWRVSPHTHPNGLVDVSQAAAAAGMKFLLWFESERCKQSAPMATEHPEYFLSIDGSTEESENKLLNLGDEKAWNYIYNSLCDTIEKLDIRCCRQDFNMDPLAHWRDNDKADRKGINEIKYINGLYRLWDSLLERFPNMIIDNCASGGRRIDVETMRRSVPLWRSDALCKSALPPEVPQCQSLNYNTWLPYSGTGIGGAHLSLDTYLIRSTYSAALSFSSRNDFTSEEERKVFRAWYEARKKEYLKARPYFCEDFYPLTEPTDKTDTWCAAQFHRPEQGDGMVQIFRRENAPYDTATFALRGLREDAVYTFTDVDGGEFTLSGKELIEKGWTVTICEKRTAKIYFYEEVRQ